MRALCFILPFVLAALTGCAGNPLTGDAHGVREVGNTSSLRGFHDYARSTCGVEKGPQIHITHVRLALNMPATIVMQKQATGEIPIITKTDKREALLSARAQMAVLDRGLRTQFEKKAIQYGVTISEMAGDVIHVDVASIYSFCEAYKGCKTRLNLRVRLTDVEGKVRWKYDGAIEQTAPKEQINQPLFDTFADTLLEAMKKDGILAD